MLDKMGLKIRTRKSWSLDPGALILEIFTICFLAFGLLNNDNTSDKSLTLGFVTYCIYRT